MRYAYICVLVYLVIPVSQVAAETAAESISLQQVIERVLDRSPQLAIHGFENQAAAARVRSAAQTTPYELQLELENFAGSGDYQSADQLESSLSLVTVLESGELIDSRRQLAQQNKHFLRNEQDGRRLDLLATVTEQFIHVVVDQQRLKVAEEYLDLVRHTLDIVSQRVRSGKSHIAEQRRQQIALANTEIELEHAEHELNTSRLKLATYWGSLDTDYGSARSDLFTLPSLPPFSQLESLLVNNPELIKLASEERLAQTRIKLAQAKQASNIKLSGGVRHFNDSDDAALMAMISIPLGSRSRALPQIEEMQAQSQQQPFRFEQQRLSLHASLYALYQEALHARTAYNTLKERIIPTARLVMTDLEKGYISGRFSLLELNEAQSALLDARLEALIAAANYHRLKVEIERLTGTNLNRGNQT